MAKISYHKPNYKFPSLSAEPGRLAAQNLGHPLLKPDAKVCNNFELAHGQKIVILTGSNMAGKSTFLRTIGVNLCLAYAGATVNADRLDASLYRLFTCIKVSDSVQDGLSYFYAEVKRLQALLAAAKADDPWPGRPVLAARPQACPRPGTPRHVRLNLFRSSARPGSVPGRAP